MRWYEADMSRDSNGSSGDPDDVQATLNNQGAVSWNSSQRDSAVSLSAMSDLDDDATPMSPDAPLSQPRYTSPNTGTSPQSNCQQQSGTPCVSITGQQQQVRDAHGHVGPGAIPGPASVSPTEFNVESSGLGYNPQLEEAVSDDTYAMSTIPRDPSKDNLKSSCSEPKHDLYDAVIISHPDDWEAVQGLKQRLNDMVLYDGKHARVAVENDYSNLGKGEISNFSQWLDKAENMYVYASETFCRNRKSEFNIDMALVESFFVECENVKREFVVPVFLENKFKCTYILRSLRAIKGIDFHRCEWTKEIAVIFRDNLNKARKQRENKARKQREERDLQNAVADMKINP